MGCDVTYLKVCVWNMGSLRCLMKNKCQNRVPGHPIYKVGHNLTGFNNILEGGIVPLITLPKMVALPRFWHHRVCLAQAR